MLVPSSRIVDKVVNCFVHQNCPQFVHKRYPAYPPVLMAGLRCTPGRREISTVLGPFIISCYQEE